MRPWKAVWVRWAAVDKEVDTEVVHPWYPGCEGDRSPGPVPGSSRLITVENHTRASQKLPKSKPSTARAAVSRRFHFPVGRKQFGWIFPDCALNLA
jgi:hypothetical protein